MQQYLEKVVSDYEAGKLSRRQFVGQLTALTALLSGAVSSALGQEKDEKGFKAIEINHLAVKVTNLERTQKFYEEVLGLKLIKQIPGMCFMACGTHFIAFMEKDVPGLDHFCLTLEKYNQTNVLAKLKALGIASETEDTRTYFSDPDGNKIQLAHDDYPSAEGRPDFSRGLKKKIYGGKPDYLTNISG